MPLANPKLVRITANIIRETYIHERSIVEGRPYTPAKKWDGGTGADGKPLISVWKTIAERVLLHGIDPGAYVRFYFSDLAVRGKTAISYYPPALSSEATIKAYGQKGKQIAEADLGDALTFQLNEASTAFQSYKFLRNVEDVEAVRAVLFDFQLDLSPLFRFCWAVSMKRKSFRPIVAKFLAPAAIQYSSNRDAYDAIWGDRIPASFKEYVQKNLGLGCKGKQV